jgi:thiol:disulfide interchange protein DsbD
MNMQRWLVAFLLCSSSKAAASWQLWAATPFEPTTQSRARAVVLTWDGKMALGLDVRLEPGWHTYWENPGDSGAAPVADFNPQVMDPPSLGAMRHPIPVRTAYGPVVSFLHEGELVFFREIMEGPSRPSGVELLPWVGKTWSSLDAEYLVCTAEECLPAVIKVDLGNLVLAQELSPEDQKVPFDAARYPKALPAGQGLDLEWRNGPDGEGVRAVLKGGGLATLRDIFEVSGKGASTRQPQAQSDGSLWIEPAGFLTLQKQSGGEISAWSGLVQVEDGEQRITYDFSDVPVRGVSSAPMALPDLGSSPKDHPSFLVMVLFAALGGLILNAMPCVFPVLSLKAMSFLRASEAASDAKVPWMRLPKRADVCYLSGVMVSILTLGIGILIIRSTGYALGWGSQLQSPVFNHLLVLLFLFLALGFWGAAPRLLAAGMVVPGLAPSAPRSPHIKEFLTGVLAVVVASPCTAPFMASALGFALFVDSAWQSLAIFAALGLGFAAPLFVLSVVPPVARLFPRPGPWLGSFERFLGFPLLLTTVWLMWVSARQIHNYPWHVALVWLVLFSLGCWLWVVTARMLPKFLAAVLAVGAVGGLVALALETPTAQSAGTAPLQGNEPQKGIVFGPWDPQRIKELRRQKVPVFVDFTARWCVTCQVNKKVVFERDDVGGEMTKLGYQSFSADWTSYDPAITHALASFGRAGVPLYVLYPADPTKPPRVLEQILTPEGFLKAVREAALVP